MNILGMGIPELLLIIVIAMIVAGPKRLMQWAYLSGRFLGQMRVVWGQMMDSVQKEFDDAGVNIKMPKDPLNRNQVRKFTQDALRPFSEPMQQAMDEYEREAKALEAEIRKDETLEVEKVAANPATPVVPQKTPKAEEPPASAPSASKAPQQKTGFGTWGGAQLPQSQDEE